MILKKSPVLNELVKTGDYFYMYKGHSVPSFGREKLMIYRRSIARNKVKID